MKTKELVSFFVKEGWYVAHCYDRESGAYFYRRFLWCSKTFSDMIYAFCKAIGEVFKVPE